ncbi:hypothetical protein PQR75_26310 [Paraburkholderia fungorum]|uniref:hypothetical protein n=1 Tax=Paraburkholderia fungorum TaxID=134537 RepID=UPI0038B81E57
MEAYAEKQAAEQCRPGKYVGNDLPVRNTALPELPRRMAAMPSSEESVPKKRLEGFLADECAPKQWSAARHAAEALFELPKP